MTEKRCLEIYDELRNVQDTIQDLYRSDTDNEPLFHEAKLLFEAIDLSLYALQSALVKHPHETP